VFKQAVVKNIILTVEKSSLKSNNTFIKIVNSENDFISNIFETSKINQQIFLSLKDNRLETKNQKNIGSIKETIWRKSISLDKICLIAYGARLNHKTKSIGKEFYIADKYRKGLKPFFEGKNIERYTITQSGWLDYKPSEHYNPMFTELFENEKIVFINVVKDRLRFAYDEKKLYNSHTVINCLRLDKLKKSNHISARKAVESGDVLFAEKYSYKFLLGVLNSSLINWYFITYLSEGLHFYPNDAKSLPIRAINFDGKNILLLYNDIIKHVDLLLKLNEEIKAEKLPTKIEQIKQRIEHSEDKINELVYQLYELTPDEIKIVEGK